MILSSHAIAGVVAARAFSFDPLLSFFAAFISHFLLDAIPHADYPLRSSQEDLKNKLDQDMRIGPDFYGDLLRIGLDLTLGFAFSFFIFSYFFEMETFLIFLGAAGGVLPDALQFAYFKLRREPLTSLQKFHIFVNNDYDRRKTRINKFFHDFRSASFLLQAIIVSVLVLISYFWG